MPGLTLVEKIATAHGLGLRDTEHFTAGRIVNIRPKYIMTHDNTSVVIGKFESISATTRSFKDAFVVHGSV